MTHPLVSGIDCRLQITDPSSTAISSLCMLDCYKHTHTHKYKHLSVSALDVERGSTRRGQSESRLMIWLKSVWPAGVSTHCYRPQSVFRWEAAAVAKLSYAKLSYATLL